MTRSSFDHQRLNRIGTHFQRYVDDGRLPGWQITVSQHGERVYDAFAGHRDVEANLHWTDDTIVRLYSNTKIVTSVAASMLWEEGAFEFRDPVSQYLPAFADTRVYVSGNAASMATVPQVEPMRIWHLLTHTSGLTYGFLRVGPVDEVYRNGGIDDPNNGLDLEAMCNKLATFPLCFQPGTEWNYSVSTDVLGRLVEVCSGMSLADFFRTRIFEPLGMTDTAFFCPPEKHDRLAALYAPLGPDRTAVRMDAMGNAAKQAPGWLSGGGGLVGTSGDYLRFLELLRCKGELDGQRLLGPRTIAMMASNHLPGNADLTEFGRPIFAETAFDGVGFGLGVSVMLDPVKAKVPGTPGDFGWGGMASTWALVDPVEQLTVFFSTQLLPSSTWPIRSQLRSLVYQALAT